MQAAAGSSAPGPDLEYIASLLDQHERGTTPAPDENATPANIVLTPTSWKQDHWLKPPPDLAPASNFKSDPIDAEFRQPASLLKLRTEMDASYGSCSSSNDGPWRQSNELTTEPPSLLERRNPAPPSPDQELMRDNIALQRRVQELQFQLQSATAVKTELQHALDLCRAREQTAQDDLAKSSEMIRELKRINQGLIEERALLDAKNSAQQRKDERLRSRLEAELARQKDLARDAADEASRLRSALQEAANESELFVQREKENWARAEALRNEQLIQRLKQEAARAAEIGPGDASVRERDIQIAQLSVQIADQQRLLEQQQKDNERLADQATKLQEMLDQYRNRTGTSPQTSLLLELKEIQEKTRSDLSQCTQAAITERSLLSSEFSDVKNQLRQMTDHFVSVEHELQQQNHKQGDIQKHIAELENRLRSMEIDLRNKPTLAESGDLDPRLSVSNELMARTQLAHHLQRAAELGVDLPPHMPRLNQQPAKQSTARKPGEPHRTSISSTTSSKPKTTRKASGAKKLIKRSQTRSPVRSRLYPPPASWR